MPVTILAAEARPLYVRVLVMGEKFLETAVRKPEWVTNTPFVPASWADRHIPTPLSVRIRSHTASERPRLDAG
ncbi:hypothetical protein LWP59_07635 [Amycolatopsis acidiphila]|uniref:hypothetical protein n=1 Tax=Amycolatopsis acidiphila TaxID=715473 RepID=UPI001643AE98|nr:hypothetical protein [Amycolatopsis acidiphila]UIJ61486.1 hypothetical protein LWP59_07635 [Amycolatopsis acidiphila]